MTQKKFDYRVTISAEYRRTFDLAGPVQDMVQGLLSENGFKKIKVGVKAIKKKEKKPVIIHNREEARAYHEKMRSKNKK